MGGSESWALLIRTSPSLACTRPHPRPLARGGRQDKSHKTKVGLIGVLRQLVAVQPGAVAGHIDTLVPGLNAALNVGARV